MTLRVSAATKAAAGLAILGAVTALAATSGSANEPPVAATRERARPPAASHAPAAKSSPSRFELGPIDLRSAQRTENTWTLALRGGRRADLTLNAALQDHLKTELARYEVPFASVVAIEPSTGRVLAYVSHSSANPAAPDLALDPTPPAASVFKLVTGSALIDAGVPETTRVCYGGGASRLTELDIRDDAARDRQCATLSDAMGGSINAVFAKLALRHLTPETLSRYASAFGFGHALPFDVPTQPSPGEVPSETLEYARTAAGFWHMHMSPFHAALIGATIANDGRMPRASIIERVVDQRGTVVHRHVPSTFRSVVSRGTARAVTHMMLRCVQDGTAHDAFFDRRGNPYIPGVTVAGKTGSLSSEQPYRGYTWWVGFAPAEAPTIAVAALVVNTPQWRIKASYVAREALRVYLRDHPPTAPQTSRPQTSQPAPQSTEQRSPTR